MITLNLNQYLIYKYINFKYIKRFIKLSLLCLVSTAVLAADKTDQIVVDNFSQSPEISHHADIGPGCSWDYSFFPAPQLGLSSSSDSSGNKSSDNNNRYDPNYVDPSSPRIYFSQLKLHNRVFRLISLHDYLSLYGLVSRTFYDETIRTLLSYEFLHSADYNTKSFCKTLFTQLNADLNDIRSAPFRLQNLYISLIIRWWLTDNSARFGDKRQMVVVEGSPENGKSQLIQNSLPLSDILTLQTKIKGLIRICPKSNDHLWQLFTNTVGAPLSIYSRTHDLKNKPPTRLTQKKQLGEALKSDYDLVRIKGETLQPAQLLELSGNDILVVTEHENISTLEKSLLHSCSIQGKSP